MSRSSLLLGVLWAVPFGACARAASEGPVRPHIVFVVADDQDNEHLGFLGHPLVQTPTLDRLAREGTVFETLVTAPRCRPSLACLLTGRWPHQNGVYYNRGPYRPDSMRPSATLPALLKQAGYATFMGGKFWEEDHRAYGFTEPDAPLRTFVRDGQDDLLAFIDRFADEQPMFVWWGPALPHWPHNPPARFEEPIRPADVEVPPWFEGDRNVYREMEQKGLATVGWMDFELGRVVRKLEERGALERTLFVYLIDNGWSTSLISKASPFDKGIRSPLVLSGLDSVPAGRRIAGLVDEVDVLPTILDYAGVAPPADVSGRSLRPVVEGASEELRDAVYGAAYGQQATEGLRPERDAYALFARTARWKYVLYLRDVREEWKVTTALVTGRLERSAGEEDLFDLAADPYELDDLALHPDLGETRAALRAGALQWWRETGGAPLPR